MSAASSASIEDYLGSLSGVEQEVARHVLLGGFNRARRPVGFHHAPNGVCPPGRRIDEIVRRYPDGAYRAKVSFWHERERAWVQKRGRHTMFPDHWTSAQVVAAGHEAYRARVDKVALRWRSRARGMPVAGFRRNDGRGPATFFPDHER